MIRSKTLSVSNGGRPKISAGAVGYGESSHVAGIPAHAATPMSQRESSRFAVAAEAHAFASANTTNGGATAVAGFVEKPFFTELLLKFLELKLERAESFRLHALHIKLVLAALGINTDAAEADHLRAVGRFERKRLVLALEHHAP